MKIEVGRLYLTRDGRKVYLYERDEDGFWGSSIGYGQLLFSEEGLCISWDRDCEGVEDLDLAPYEDPKLKITVEAIDSMEQIFHHFMRSFGGYIHGEIDNARFNTCKQLYDDFMQERIEMEKALKKIKDKQCK